MQKTGLIVAALAGVSAFAMPAAAQGQRGDVIANQYICFFHPEAVPRGLARVAAEGAARPNGGRVMHVYTTAARGFSVYASERGVQQMVAKNPGIERCKADRVVDLGPSPTKGPPFGGTPTPTPTSEVRWDITRVNGGVDMSTKTAWIIDTGVDLDHPDLVVDTGRSVNFVSKGKDTGPDDLNGHGTHVAGTIAAKKNGKGMAGVAPGSTVVAVRVLDRNGSGSWSDVLAGIDYVAKNAAAGDVANMSLGGGADSDIDNAVINASNGIDANGNDLNKHVFFTLAAGNESDDANNHSPARANGPYIYTISAIDVDDKWAYFSNYGNPPIDFAEPGYSIYSTYKDGGYATLSGTSMAAPHAAGILMLGPIKSGGTVADDPDTNKDIIGVH
ncbi:S8 family serine peptidase [Croceicoccus bisphenolivorans]|uniref:S8 family serine peptidase n=1 Tax=Croceicoccus bisphenolivorans TaxID=1783232 RepID=UPI00082D11A6|nr:S8 family serine peptidase [Croceicoccus bisphenolivorans]